MASQTLLLSRQSDRERSTPGSLSSRWRHTKDDTRNQSRFGLRPVSLSPWLFMATTNRKFRQDEKTKPATLMISAQISACFYAQGTKPQDTKKNCGGYVCIYYISRNGSSNTTTTNSLCVRAEVRGPAKPCRPHLSRPRDRRVFRHGQPDLRPHGHDLRRGARRVEPAQSEGLAVVVLDHLRGRGRGFGSENRQDTPPRHMVATTHPAIHARTHARTHNKRTQDEGLLQNKNTAAKK